MSCYITLNKHNYPIYKRFIQQYLKIAEQYVECRDIIKRIRKLVNNYEYILQFQENYKKMIRKIIFYV